MKRAFPKVSDTAQERRTHIIESAIRIIASEGFAGLSVRTVADQAGCSRGLVEHYFKNKASLIIAANNWANETYMARVSQAVGEQKGLSALKIRLQQLLPYEEKILNEWRVRVAFWQQATNDQLIVANNLESFRSVYDAILEDMRCAQDEGEIAASVPIIEASEMVLFIIIGIATVCLSNADLREKRPLDRRVEMILRQLTLGDLTGLQVGDPNVEY